MHRHAQHLLKCQNELHTAEGESKARQAVPSSCLEPVLDVDGSVPHPRDGNGGRRRYKERRRRRHSQTEVAAFYLDPYDTKPLLLSLFLND